MTTLDMQFKKDADVFDENGEKVGTIDRVVIDPRTKKITHVVVRQGFLFTEDKVVPVTWFRLTTDNEVLLKTSEEDVEALPVFEETHYLPWHEVRERESPPPPDHTPAPAYYWYPNASVYWWGYPGYRTYFGFAEPPYATVVERNIPEGTVPLAEGANVLSAEGKHVGDVEQVLADPDSGHATHFVISQGLIFKDKKLVPTAWISAMRDENVYLDVDAEFLEELAEYED